MGEQSRTSACAVIVNYNAGDHLVECTRSLRAEGVEEIVVADNASRDGSIEALRSSDPEVRVVSMGGNHGFGTAANRGVQATAAPVVLVMNPDVVAHSGSVAALVGALDADQSAGAVGPRLDNTDGTRYPSARRFPDLGVAIGHAFLERINSANPYTRAYRMADLDPDRASEVDWISGACMALRRSAFDAVGGFDPRYFMYVEDVDLCWRLWQAGWRVRYEPAARLTHTVAVSTNQAPYRMILAHHASLWQFVSKTTTGRQRLLLPAVAGGLAVRTGLAWAERAWAARGPASRDQ